MIGGATVALVLGWMGQNERWLWTSIGASVLAAVLLALAYYRSRLEAAAALRRRRARRPERRSESAVALPGLSSGTATRPATPAQSRVGPRPQGGPGDVEVIAIPSRRRYHRPECRYARARGARRVPRSIAKKRAYGACTICKP